MKQDVKDLQEYPEDTKVNRTPTNKAYTSNFPPMLNFII